MKNKIKETMKKFPITKGLKAGLDTVYGWKQVSKLIIDNTENAWIKAEGYDCAVIKLNKKGIKCIDDLAKIIHNYYKT